jgi:hypothetical protein
VGSPTVASQAAPPALAEHDEPVRSVTLELTKSRTQPGDEESGEAPVAGDARGEADPPASGAGGASAAADEEAAGDPSGAVADEPTAVAGAGRAGAAVDDKPKPGGPIDPEPEH